MKLIEDFRSASKNLNLAFHSPLHHPPEETNSYHSVLEWWHGSRKLTVYEQNSKISCVQVSGGYGTPDIITIQLSTISCQTDIETVWLWLHDSNRVMMDV